jgi:hypothetical protein
MLFKKESDVIGNGHSPRLLRVPGIIDKSGMNNTNGNFCGYVEIIIGRFYGVLQHIRLRLCVTIWIKKGLSLDSVSSRRIKSWWAVAESNCGHEAFQASALPTELTAHG